MLDPWLEPLPRPSPTAKTPPNSPPILVINSPGFTIWKGHFPRLVDIVRKMNGNLVTLMGSNRKWPAFPRFKTMTHPYRCRSELLRLPTLSPYISCQSLTTPIEDT